MTYSLKTEQKFRVVDNTFPGRIYDTEWPTLKEKHNRKRIKEPRTYVLFIF